MPNTIKAESPEALGIKSENILAFLNGARDINYKLWSFLIMRHDRIALEGAAYPFDHLHKHLVYSVSKTFTSTAVGTAVKEGLLDIHRPVIEFFPELADKNIDPAAKTITIENLLEMATGHASDSVGDMCNCSGSWPEAFFSKEIVFQPGTHFVYDSGGTYMLSEIISRVTGMNLFAWAKKTVFDPLEIDDVLWDHHNGVTTAAWGLFISPRDLAKLGMMYKNKGVYKGKRILTEEWISNAASVKISTGGCNGAGWSKGYGYQIWQNNEGSYRADGAFGQYIMVFPKEDMVIVTTSEECDGSRLFPLVENFLLKDLADHPYPKDSHVLNTLKNRIKEMESPKLFAPTSSYMEETISHKQYRLYNEEEEHNISFITDNSLLTVKIDDLETIISSNVTYHMGESQPALELPTCSPLLGAEQRNRSWLYAARHTWPEDGLLVIEIVWKETGHTQKWVFDFTERGEKLTLKIGDSGKQMLAVLGLVSDRNMAFKDIRFQGDMIQ